MSGKNIHEVELTAGMGEETSLAAEQQSITDQSPGDELNFEN